jgi:hypothetical protein
MMSKPKSRLINSGSALAFLLALSFAFCASQAYTEDLEAMSSPPQTMFLDTTGEVAEWWICYSYSSGVQTCINTHRADIQSAAEVEHTPSEFAREAEPSAEQPR